MRPWEYSPKLETAAQPAEPEVVQQTDNLAAPECHPLHTPRPPVYLPVILLRNLMVWTAQYYELRIVYSGGVILNAQPHHITETLQAHPWGVVCDPERYLLLSWGNVPAYELQGLRDLETGEPLIHEAVAA